MVRLMFAIGLALSPSTAPIEGIRTTFILSEAAAAQLRSWRDNQAQKKGPPTPHVWIRWQLQRLPVGQKDNEPIIGLERFVFDRTPLTVNAAHLGAGLWQMRAHLQDDSAGRQETLLIGWRCVEVKMGVKLTMLTLRLEPIGDFEIKVNLDRPPRPDDPAVIAVCLYDDDSLIDLLIVEMKGPNATIQCYLAPQGNLEVQAVVLSDTDDVRQSRSHAVVRHGTVFSINLARPASSSQPATPLTRGGRFLLLTN